MNPLVRIANLLARGSVALSNAALKMQTLQVRLLAGEIKDEMEHFEPFGFTSNPKPGAEVVAAFFDGDRSHGVVLIAADRRYRIKNLLPGEAALYNANADKIVLHMDGTIEIVAATKVKITTPLVEITSPSVTMSGTLTVQGVITGAGGMAISGGSGASINGAVVTTGTITNNGKNIGSTHAHSGVQTGAGNTGVPI